MTLEDLNQTAEMLSKVWTQLSETIQAIADAINRYFGQAGIDIRALLYPDEQKPRSPKHAYHFPSKRRHVKSRLVCVYAPDLKPQRNLPYQRRNY